MLIRQPRSPSKTIDSINRGLKSSVTKQLVSIGIESPIWQRNYYEHIIRNEDSYHKISDYIRNNPAQWQEDEYCNPFYAIDPELFDFHQIRFSFGETTEEATRKRKSKSY